jgi:hypothetical protein
VKLLPNWKQVLFGSWSSRLGFLATLLGGLEVVLPAFQDVVPRGVFAIATVIVTSVIPVVRVIQQQELQSEQAEQKNG